MLEQCRAAGFGGVEICPIYGAKGYEQRYLPFLSPQWMRMLAHVTREAKRLDLGVDLTTGTGWPFGGPQVSPQHASTKVVLKSYALTGGERLKDPLPDGVIEHVVARSDGGDEVDLTERVKDRALDWTAPPGQSRIYVLTHVAAGPQ